MSDQAETPAELARLRKIAVLATDPGVVQVVRESRIINLDLLAEVKLRPPRKLPDGMVAIDRDSLHHALSAFLAAVAEHEEGAAKP